MKDISEWQVSKWPFLLVGGLSVVAGLYLGLNRHPNYLLAVVTLALGDWLACLPWLLEYRATKKLVELNALTTVAEQLAGLKNYSQQITDATGQWALVQDATKGQAEKTVTAAREIADRMSEELREFNEFQAKLNDAEKKALRLEVDKHRRGESEWLQVVARMLDHIFALHNAASRSGNTELAEQIGNFQTACRDAARRVGLTLFSAAAGEYFDDKKHRAHGVENPPSDSMVAETLAPGMTFQGRLIRPALVRLQNTPAAAAPAAEPDSTAQPADPAPEKAEADEAPKAPGDHDPAKPGSPPDPGQLSLGAE